MPPRFGLRSALGVGLLLLVVLLVACRGTPLAGPAPSDLGRRLDSTPIEVSDFEGELLLINFWASWCPPCVAEWPYLVEIQDRYADRGLKVLAVNVGETGAVVQRFLRRGEGKLAVSLDPSRKISRSYQARSLPTTVLVAPTGEIVWTHTGFSSSSFRNLEAEVRRRLPR